MMLKIVFFLFGVLLAGISFFLAKSNQKLRVAYRLLEQKTEALERLSHTDALTHIANRLHMDEMLTTEVNRFNRYRIDLSAISLDIDFFKRVNDQYGHPAGDRLLIDLTRLINDQLRSTDIFGRWGGEEFLILCPATSKEEAIYIAEKLRLSIEKEAFEGVGHITVSFGVTSIRDGDAEKELVARADEQLYRAKNEGRNRVCHD